MNSIRSTCAIFVVLSALLVTSCNVIKELGQAVTNLSRCSFKLESITDFRLAGVALTGKSGLNFAEAAHALGSFARGELQASFTLNVAAQNPNTGAGGTTKSSATLTSFAWTLLIDDVQTIAGNISEPIEIPGTGQQSIIPLRMNLDLLKFFNERGYEKIVNLALALGGAQGSASRVTLRAKPTITTDFGPLTYPGELQIIDKEFRGR